MKFAFVTLYITDMERSLSFYQGLLGLPLLRRNPTAEGELAFLGEAGQPNIELIYSPRHVGNTYTGFSVGIAVDSLEEATEKLTQSGVQLLHGPVSPIPTVTFSIFRGPDGEEVELIEYKA